MLRCNRCTFNTVKELFGVFRFSPSSIISTQHPWLCRINSIKHPEHSPPSIPTNDMALISHQWYSTIPQTLFCNENTSNLYQINTMENASTFAKIVCHCSPCSVPRQMDAGWNSMKHHFCRFCQYGFHVKHSAWDIKDSRKDINIIANNLTSIWRKLKLIWWCYTQYGWTVTGNARNIIFDNGTIFWSTNWGHRLDDSKGSIYDLYQMENWS